MKRLLMLSLAILMSTSIFAAGEARITGTVVDAEGEPIAGATITVTAVDRRNIEKSVESGEDGSYALFLADGTLTYRLSAEKEGYSPFSQERRFKLLPTKNVIEITLVDAEKATPVKDATNPAYAIFNEGVRLANEGNAEEALAKFNEAVEVDPKLAAGWKALARLYARTSQWKKAIEAGEKAIELGTEDEVLNSILADAYTMTGNKGKASEYQRIAPANPAVLFNKAVPFLNDNNDAEAEKLLLQAVEVDDSFAKAHYELGSLYARQSKNDLAEKHLLRYLELAPEGENAVFARELLKYLN